MQYQFNIPIPTRSHLRVPTALKQHCHYKPKIKNQKLREAESTSRMEKHKSFSFKSSKFFALSFILAFSLVIFSFYSALLVKDSSVGSLHQLEAHLEFERPSLVKIQNVKPAVDSRIGDLSSFSLNSSTIYGTKFNEPETVSPPDEKSAYPGTKGEENGTEVAWANKDVVGTYKVSTLPISLGEKTAEERSDELEENGSEKKASDDEDGAQVSLEENSNSTFSINRMTGEDSQEPPIVENESQPSTYGKVVIVEVDDDEIDDDDSDNEMAHLYKGDFNAPVGVLWTEKKACDVSKGRWVPDESYPLYSSFSCPFIEEGFNCKDNGRSDSDYMKWRWQPNDCDILRFNATRMLESLRGKRLVFVGDASNRNQWESMLCMLMEGIEDPENVYETQGQELTKDKDSYIFRFEDYQCTVEFYVSHYLVQEGKAKIGQKKRPALRIDRIYRGSTSWRGADVIIFNTASWWTDSKTRSGTYYYQEGKRVYPHLGILTAYERSLTTWANWVDRHTNPQRTRVFFRTSAPTHFRGGALSTAGHCKEARSPLNVSKITRPEKDLIVARVIQKMRTPVTLLNVTGLSAYRIDGHPSIFGNKLKGITEDCSQWCLPGVPDSWNELLYHHLVSERPDKFIYAS